MKKNLILEICKMLDLKVGEEFKIEEYDDDKRFFFTDDGDLNFYYNDAKSNLIVVAQPTTIAEIVCGRVEIVKLPWRPHYGEHFWTFTNPCCSGSNRWKCRILTWNGEVNDFARYKSGWVFKTRKEAEAALPKTAKEMGVKFYIEKNKKE